MSFFGKVRHRLYVVLFLWVCQCTVSVQGQDLPAPLREGVAHFEQGAYELAYHFFTKQQEKPSSPALRQAVDFWQCRSAIALQHPTSEDILRRFRVHYPSHPEGDLLVRAFGDYLFSAKEYRQAGNYYALLHPSDAPQSATDAQLAFGYAQCLIETGRSPTNKEKRRNPLFYLDGLKQTNYAEALQARYLAAQLRVKYKVETNIAIQDLEAFLHQLGTEAALKKIYNDALTMLLKAFEQKKQMQDVDRWLKKFDAFDLSKRPNIYLHYKAQRLYAAENYAQVILYLNELQRRQGTKPLQDDLALALGYAYAMTQQYDRAIELWSAVHIPEGDVFARVQLAYNLAKAHLQKNQTYKAQEYFLQVLEATNDEGKSRELHHNSLRTLIQIQLLHRSPETLSDLCRLYLERYSDSQHTIALLSQVIVYLCQEARYTEALTLLGQFPRREAPILHTLYQLFHLERAKGYYADEAPADQITADLDLVIGKYNQNQEYTTEALLLAGQIYLQSGETDKAEQYLKSVDDNQAKYLLGYVFIAQKDYGQAFKFFQAYAYDKTSPPSLVHQNDARLRMSDCKLALQEYTAAQRQYERLFQLMPDQHPYIRYQQGMIHKLQQDYDQALRCFQEVCQAGETTVYCAMAQLEQADIYKTRRQTEEAIRLYGQVIAQAKGIYLAPARYYRGDLYWGQNRTDQAIKDFVKLIEDYPTHPHATNAMQLLEQAALDGHIIPTLEKIRQVYAQANPDNPVLLNQQLNYISQLLFQDGNNQEAIKRLIPLGRQYLQTEQGNRICFLLGYAYEQTNQYPLAHGAYKHLNPNKETDFCKRGWRSQAKLYQIEKNYIEEAKTLQKILDYEDNKTRKTRLLERLADNALQQDNLPLLEDVLQQMQQRKLDNHTFQAYIRGEIERKKKNLTAAIRFFEQAAQERNDPEIRQRSLFALAQIRFQETNYAQAVQYLYQIEGTLRDLPALLWQSRLLLTESLARMGKTAQAKIAAKELLGMAGKNTQRLEQAHRLIVQLQLL